jgi:pSer/pThr/pTyr-binding forkhead associated (FHA) protein
MKLSAYKNNQLVAEYSAPQLSESESYEVFIGRSEDCHLHLDDPQISREHAIVFFNNGKWFIKRLTDIGTIIMSGESIFEKELASGESIELGPFLIEVSIEASAPEPVIEEVVPEIEEPIADEPVEDEISATEISSDIPEEDSLDISDEDTEVMESNENLPVESDGLEVQEFSEGGDLEPIADEQPVEEEVDEFSELDSDLDGDDGDFGGGLELSDEETNVALEVEASAEEEIQEDSLDGGFEDDGFGEGDAGFDDDGGGGFDDDGGGGFDDEDSTAVFTSFASFELQIFGEHAPYDRYVIEDDEVYIGRDQKKCKIILDDNEVSGRHAVIKKEGSNLVLEDLGSSNGTILNGERINKAELTNGDEFLIGSTSFTVMVKSDLLEEEADTLMPVEEPNPGFTPEGVTAQVGAKDRALDFGGADEFAVEGAEPPKKKKNFVRIALVALVGLFLLLPDEEEGKDKAKKGQGQAQKKSKSKDGTKKVADQKPKKAKKKFL